MFRLKAILFGVLISIMCWMPSGCTTQAPSEISVAGSTTILPFMLKVSESDSREGNDTIQIYGGGSSKGIRELVDGKCNIAMSSTAISDKTRSNAESTNVLLKGFPFASDLIVPIVHPSNPINTLSLAQLRAIYEGNIKSWDTLGGPVESIQVVTRGESSGTEKVWKDVVMKSGNIQPGSVLQNSSSGILAFVAENPSAIGYVSYALLNPEVKPLSVNGIAPDRGGADPGKFPISRRLYLYVDKKNFPQDIKSLIVFVLSGKGQKIAKECGFIPLNPLN